MSRASAELLPRRPLAVMLSVPETVTERLSRMRRPPRSRYIGAASVPPVRNRRFVLTAAVRLAETTNVLLTGLTERMVARVGTPVPDTNMPGRRPRPATVSLPPRVIVAWPDAPVGAVAVAAARPPPETTTSPERTMNHWPFAVSTAKVCGVVKFSVPVPTLPTE